jgi:hypothetical protein
MFTPQQYRAKAAKYSELVETAASDEEKREFKELQDSYLALAANTQWMDDNQDKTVHPPAAGGEPPQFVNQMSEAEKIRSDAVQDKAAIATWADEGGAPLAPSQQQQGQQQQAQRRQSPAVHEADNEKAVT